MVFNTFSDVMEYCQTHTSTEILHAIMIRLLPRELHETAVGDEAVEKMQAQLNQVSRDRYTSALGDVIHDEVIDILENGDHYRLLYEELLTDEISRGVLANLMAYRLTRDPQYLVAAFCPDSCQYFDEQIVSYKNDCVYADCGALDGETTAEFILHCPSYQKVYLYEPIKEYYNDCLKNIGSLQDAGVVFRQAAVCDTTKTLRFSGNIAGSSRANDQGDLLVEGVSLDNDIAEPLGFIKMDIEGSEKEALLGAKKHIQLDSPALAICVYHLAEDIWKIPSMILEMNPQYRFYLRHHTLTPDETVLYALPKNSSFCTSGKQLPDAVKLSCLEALYAIRKSARTRVEGQRKSEMGYLQQQLSNFHKALAAANQTMMQMQEQIQSQHVARLYYEKQMKGYEELKSWAEEVTKAKAYYEEQMKGYEELKGWAEEITKAKAYYEEQMKGYEELKGWAEELTKAKAFLQQELANRDAILEKMSTQMQKKGKL